MNFSKKDIDRLRTSIKDYMTSDRYNHTLGVEASACRLGEQLLSGKLDELSIAALLHDITKEMSAEEQLLILAKDYNYLTAEDLETIPALHSFSGARFIKDKYSYYATDEICRAVFTHTLGDENMDIFSEIIYLADYIEDGRKLPESRNLADKVYSELSISNSQGDRENILHNAVYTSLSNTVDHLVKCGYKVNSRTIRAIKKYEGIKKQVGD